mgnify:FL=1
MIKLAKEGNQEAFTKAILLIEDELYKIARARLDCESDIEDAVQETIIEAFYSLKKLRKIEYFKTWIIRILINKCNRIYKKRKKEIMIDDEYIINNKTSNIIENTEGNINFYNIIENLNYEERVVLILHYDMEYTTKDISKILKMKENTVKSKILRSKKKIKNILKGEVYYG